MESLPVELIVWIVNCKCLRATFQLNFLATCKRYYQLTDFLKINETISIFQHSVSLKHYDNMLNVIVERRVSRLPQNVQSVKLKSYLNFNLSLLPPTAHTLILSDGYIGEEGSFYRDQLPNLTGITTLHLGSGFNQSIDQYLPPNLTKLVFGHNFNQPIKSRLPISLTQLTFGHHFNQSIANCLPTALTHLVLGECFDRSLYNCLPASLTHLRLEHSRCKSIGDYMLNVKYLFVRWYYYHDTFKNFPSNITHFECKSVETDDDDRVDGIADETTLQSINHHLPATVTYLKINDCILRDPSV